MVEFVKPTTDNGLYKLYRISSSNPYRASSFYIGSDMAPSIPAGEYIVAASMEEALQGWREKPGTVNKRISPALVECIGVVAVVK